MSEINTKKIDSLLPEDIESLINKINSEIASLERRKFDLGNEVEAKEKELALIESHIKVAKDNYNSVSSASVAIEVGLKERESKVSKKEADLDLYSNALQEKEKNVNKYLAVFDGIRNVLKK